MSNQTLKKKVNDVLKTLFFLPHYASLLSKENFKMNCTHCSKLCLVKCIILLEKQDFRIFPHSNIRNETKAANKNHFLSFTLCISVKVSKFKNKPRHCSKLCLVKYIISFENQHFRIFLHSNIRNESK